MALIPADSVFNPDEHENDIVGIASELTQHDSGPHCHKKGQLLFSQQGCMRITLNDSICLLPPARVAWIPPGVMHRVQIRGVVGYRSIYVDNQRHSTFSPHVEVLSVTALLREILERIAFADFSINWRQGAAAHIWAVCEDEINSAWRESTFLPLPKDRRLKCLSEMELPPLLQQLAVNNGATGKTISRIMMKETGLNYQQWRQQWRLFKAIELLAEAYPVTEIASILEFSSDSAFATFFRNMTGSTPRAYMMQQK
ncbi:helix-turn-helix domain-containing protein [Klebsiella sp. BIGb0407]|uniref:AraC family transcriptional regulator n=1 Tax=Klebsiella sp. BIGb0407 TaxID=2940603 RepID=UPI00216725BD|nr:helix-turn-helix domain-containing protein [Klebsiella sp. BIGb0407]MCS3429678.1 AraC-like DNA-binding protein [Klebsiella sp. BIGb0407]